MATHFVILKRNNLIKISHDVITNNKIHFYHDRYCDELHYQRLRRLCRFLTGRVVQEYRPRCGKSGGGYRDITLHYCLEYGHQG